MQESTNPGPRPRRARATLLAPALTGPIVVAVTVAVFSTAFIAAMILGEGRTQPSELAGGMLAIPGSTLMALLIFGLPMMLVSYPISLIALSLVTPWLKQAGAGAPAPRARWLWWLVGGIIGLAVAGLCNLVIESRPTGWLMFARRGDGATLLRISATIACAVAGAATFGLWRRVAYRGAP